MTLRQQIIAARAEELLTVKEVALAMKVSTAAVYAWCEKGELKHVRLFDNAIRIESAELRAFVQGRRK